MKKQIFFIGLLLFTMLSWGQGLKADGKKIVNSNGEEVLLRGIGPGGWQIMEGYMMNTSGVAGSQHEIKEKLIDLMGETNTETFFQKWRENHFTKRDVDSMAAWGYNSIRIPMHYNLFTLPIEDEPIAGENTWIETGFELIDDVLEWSAPHNIYVILDMHATPGAQGTGSEINDYDPDKPSLWESQENRDKLVAIWTRIAERYKDNEWIGGYDLINETHWDLGNDNALLREVFEDITEGIRGVGDNHILYIEGNSYANDYRGLTPPWDDNLVYSFHKYWSFNNENDVDWILPLREEHNVPLWMGESGENSNTWFTDAISLFENNNIGWAWWTMRKIGDIDSPYAVDINPGYQKILDYWKDEGPRPTSQETFDGMMQLCENLLVENSRYRKDVPDACIRQVQTDETIPFNGTPATIPGVVHMADFDLGKNEFAYSDADVADYVLSTGEYIPWNKGWSYRNDGVDIEKNNDDVNSNGFHVGFINKGEWIKYTVQVDETAVYKANVRVATQENGGEFFLSLDDQEVTTIQTVSSTGGWSTFTTIEVSDIILEEGERSLKLHFSNSIPFNISSIEFEKIGTVDALELNALNGKTGENENSIEIAISETLLAASLDGTLGQFTVNVNGEERVIISVDENPLKDRTFVLTLDKYLIKSDDITVSYSGTTIQSQSAKILNAFTDLPINNESPDRVILPGLIEVEDYDYMIGMALEDTTDEGGGKNFSFTDPGDYADYSIFVPQSGNYGIKFRVASLFAEGQIGLYSVDENDFETELVVVNTVITGGWQTWETVADNLFIEEGIHKLRMRILVGQFNFNWMEFGSPDSDNDGVLDANDLCPNTPENTFVDVTGCEIFSLSADNFSLTTTSETCRSQNNGSIVLSAIENHDYSVTLFNDNFSGTKTFTSEVALEDLSAGTYTLCVTINGNSTYEQCFTVIVIEPDLLSVSTSGKSSKTKKVTVSLAGGQSYYVTLNNETTITSASEIELELNQGTNNLSVKTNKDCQGVYNKTIIFNSEPFVYPNPIKNNTISINSFEFSENEVPVEIYNLKGQLLFSKSYNSATNQLKIDVSNIPNGIYILKIISKEEIFNYKIIK
ncbi:MAG: endoglucanase [Glaciecola sp.]|jgi:endoglucanase